MYDKTVSRARQDPRANQKARTRAAIVGAAQELRAVNGESPAVAEAAARAGVSRATAYRYFPTQEALEVEVAGMTPYVEEIETALAELATDDVEQRLLALLDAFYRIALAHEPDFRRALWVYQDTWLRGHRRGEEAAAVREGRRMRWLDRVLEPLDTLPDECRRRLEATLALTLGGDSLVVMKDVCGLEDDQAVDVLRRAAVTILRAALAEAGAG